MTGDAGPRPRTPFAEWLADRLRARRLSQRQLALRSGVDHATVSRLLRDGRVPSLATAAKLASALGGATSPEAIAAGLAAVVAGEPTARVEQALRADPLLDEGQVARLMSLYRGERARGGRAAAPGEGAADEVVPSPRRNRPGRPKSAPVTSRRA